MCAYSGGVWRKRMIKKEGEKRRGNLRARVQAAFGVLLERHPFSVRVYLLHILFIAVSSAWDISAFKQLRHVSLRRQENQQAEVITDWNKIIITIITTIQEAPSYS